jgi:hypothetical protein
MIFDEVILTIKANKNPDERYVGLFFNSEEKYFGYYEISLDSEDLDWIGIYFEGGHFFDDSGEEDSYSLDDVPADAKKLLYRNKEGLPDIYGCTSEFALFSLFPSLPDPDDVWTASDKADFAKAVDVQMKTWGRV